MDEWVSRTLEKIAREYDREYSALRIDERQYDMVMKVLNIVTLELSREHKEQERRPYNAIMERFSW